MNKSKACMRRQVKGRMLKVSSLLLAAYCLLHTGALRAQQPQAQSGQPIYAVNAKWVNGVAPGYWPTAGSGLTLNLSAGSAVCDRSAVTYAGGTLTMTASSTIYVYLDLTNSCAPASNTTGFTDATVPIAKVVTGASTITSITDVRVGGFSGARILDSIAFADRFAGATADVKIANAVAALPVAGGVVDARGLTGAQTISSTVTVPAYVRVILGAATYNTSGSPGFSIATGANGASGCLEGQGAATNINYTAGGYAIDLVAGAYSNARPCVSNLLITGTSLGLAGVRVSQINSASIYKVRVTGFTNGDGFRNEGANLVSWIDCNSYANLVGLHQLSKQFSGTTFTPNANTWLGGHITSNTQYGVWEDPNSPLLAAPVGNQYIGGAIEENGTASSGSFVNVFLQWSSLATFRSVYFENTSPSPVPLYHIVLGGTNQAQFPTFDHCVFNSSGYTAVIHNANGTAINWIGSVNSTGNPLIDTDDTFATFIGGNAGNVGFGTLLPIGHFSVAANQTSGTTDTGQITVQGTTNPNQRTTIGYNTTGDYGFLRAVKSGTTEEPLILNESGVGKVGIGKNNPSQMLDVAKSAAFGVNPVIFSATPTFNASLGNTQTITLTGNVTSSTLSNATTGQWLVFDITEDATGGRTFVFPTNVKGAGTLNTTASKHNVQMFYFDGANAWAASPMQSN